MQLEELAKKHNISVDEMLVKLKVSAMLHGNDFFNTLLDALIEDYQTLKRKIN